jgi:hypothetical protein
LVALSLSLAFTVDVDVSDEAGIVVSLPDAVGAFHGDELRFCQEVSCQETVPMSETDNRDECPKCGGKLDSMSRSERALLPADTIVLKKRYESPEHEVLFASIVMSGAERASIHRPQICLVGQGNEIVHSEVEHVPVAGRKKLDVMVLDMLRRWRTPDGQQREHPSYYAYWFVGKNRETASHTMRMFWMAFDRVFLNTSHRWAYISVSGNRDEEGAYRERMKAFVSELYPHMLLPEDG